ncbi:hypothetical protein [Sphingomonas sp. Leaf230]|nr:hypothetical protein [Sphingomonas sp. Leaf230]
MTIRYMMLAGVALVSTAAVAQVQPPRVAKKSFQVTSPNGAREDD